MPAHTSPWRRPAQHFPLFPHHLTILVLLAIATLASLIVHADVNSALLWSQCHSHSLLPGLSRIPLLGTPFCFAISFFQAALDSVRSTAVLSVIFALFGSMTAILTLESARKVNAGNLVIANPTLPLLVFNLIGGSILWQLVIVPAFLRVAQQAPSPEQEASHDDEERDPLQMDKGRQIAQTEAIAIPVGMAVGFYAPTYAMVITKAPVAIGVWLFWPLYVSAIRQVIKYILGKVDQFRSDPSIHLESHIKSLVALYALPVMSSVVAHVFFIISLTLRDDRKDLTRSTESLFMVDLVYLGVTYLYWVFVEAGWRAPLAASALAVVLGPGAGAALTWLYREKLLTSDLVLQLHHSVAEEAGNASEPNEETPLIQ